MDREEQFNASNYAHEMLNNWFASQDKIGQAVRKINELIADYYFLKVEKHDQYFIEYGPKKQTAYKFTFINDSEEINFFNMASEHEINSVAGLAYYILAYANVFEIKRMRENNNFQNTIDILENIEYNILNNAIKENDKQVKRLKI